MVEYVRSVVMRTIIKVENLSKTYKVLKKEEGVKGSLKSLVKRTYEEKIAVNDVSFEICEGEFVGFIGPNGAGKTTTIKVLSGIIYPTKGKISVLGYVPQKLQNEFKRKISVTMGQKNQLWWDIPAKDSFNLLRVIYKIPNEQYRKTLDELTQTLEVGMLLETPLRNLSLGERMKMEIIGALLHNPQVLFLDEPTIGLDATSRRNIREFLKYVNDQKKTTIMLTSHYLEDINYLCSRIIAINKGKKEYDGSLSNIRNKVSNQKLVIVSSYNVENFDMLRKYGNNLEIKNNTLKMRANKDTMSDLGRLLFNNDIFFNINIEEVSLDETFEILFEGVR